MTVFKCLLLLFVNIVLLSPSLLSQDKIYLEMDIRECKITEISLVAIKFINPKKPSQTLILPTGKVLLLSNSTGDYIVPSRLDTTTQQGKELIARFLSPSLNPIVKDHVFTIEKNRIDANIVKEDDHFIYLSDSVKLDKKSIVAVVYRTGQSKIYVPATMAETILGEIQQATLQRSPTLAESRSEDKSSASVRAAPSTTSVAFASVNTPVVVDHASTATPISSDHTPLPAPKAKPDSSRALTFEELAGNVSKKEFEEKAEKKTRQFTDYLKILCDKSANYEDINKAISQAVTLFINENALVETSSANNNDVTRLKIRAYLNKVKRIQYDKIEIEWTHVQYVNDLRPGPDGNFYGVVSFEQVFRGYRDGKLVYSDITRKDAQVVLKTYQKSYEGATKSIWDVLLSDIGVVATKSL